MDIVIADLTIGSLGGIITGILIPLFHTTFTKTIIAGIEVLFITTHPTYHEFRHRIIGQTLELEDEEVVII